MDTVHGDRGYLFSSLFSSKAFDLHSPWSYSSFDNLRFFARNHNTAPLLSHDLCLSKVFTVFQASMISIDSRELLIDEHVKLAAISVELSFRTKFEISENSWSMFFHLKISKKRKSDWLEVNWIGFEFLEIYKFRIPPALFDITQKFAGQNEFSRVDLPH